MAPFSDYALSPNAYPQPLSPGEFDSLRAQSARRPEAKAPRGGKRKSAAIENPVRSAEIAEPDGTPVSSGTPIPIVSSSSPSTSPAERQTAQQLLTSIGQKFAENRQKSKSKAFEIYQRDLATNSGALVMGGAVTLKELTVLLMDLEGFVKSTQKEGETPATILSQYLRGEIEITE